MMFLLDLKQVCLVDVPPIIIGYDWLFQGMGNLFGMVKMCKIFKINVNVHTKGYILLDVNYI